MTNRVITVAAVVALGILGVVLAVVGAFYSVLVVHVIGIPVPVGILIAVIGNLAVCILGATGVESRIGAIVPGITWIATALVLAGGRPEGDVVLPAPAKFVGHLGEIFLYAGIAAATAGIVIGPIRRGRPRPPRSPQPPHSSADRDSGR